MKVLILCCVLTCLGVAARAQQQQQPAPAAPPDIAVEKYEWSKQRIDWERDPFSSPAEGFQDPRRRLLNERRLQRAKAGGTPGEVAKVEREIRDERVTKTRPSSPPSYAFQYKLTLRNNGAKAIREIDWDYVFLDAATGQELGRREFTGVEKIGPGKNKELSFMTVSPPVRRISVESLDKKEREGLVERVVLVRVLYEDGTVWQRP